MKDYLNINFEKTLNKTIYYLILKIIKQIFKQNTFNLTELNKLLKIFKVIYLRDNFELDNNALLILCKITRNTIELSFKNEISNNITYLKTSINNSRKQSKYVVSKKSIVLLKDNDINQHWETIEYLLKKLNYYYFSFNSNLESSNKSTNSNIIIALELIEDIKVIILHTNLNTLDLKNILNLAENMVTYLNNIYEFLNF